MPDFAPSVYEHCARIIERRPWEVSRDPDLMFRGQAAAYRLYRHRPVVVGVDIYNVEAEAYGAEVMEPDGNGIPAVGVPCCDSIEDVQRLRPFDPNSAGRIPMLLDVGRRLRVEFPEADIRIPVAGPFSVAANVLHLELLLGEVLMNPERTRKALLHLAEGQLGFCQAVVEAGLDIAFFESAAAPPLLSPELFREVELPALQFVLAGTARITGHAIPCIMGGNTTPILDEILSTGTSYVICPAPTETDQAAFLRIMEARPDVMVRVNMRPDVVAQGPWRRIQEEVDRVLRLIARRRRVCLGTGALPYETPPENVLDIRNYLENRG